MTASECKNLRAELVELKHIVAQVAPKPMFSQPPDIILGDFERQKNKIEQWYSAPFYTHVGGYKMCLKIYP